MEVWYSIRIVVLFVCGDLSKIFLLMRGEHDETLCKLVACDYEGYDLSLFTHLISPGFRTCCQELLYSARS